MWAVLLSVFSTVPSTVLFSAKSGIVAAGTIDAATNPVNATFASFFLCIKNPPLHMFFLCTKKIQ